MKLLLSKLPWFNNCDIWVTGFIFTGEKFLREKDLADYFRDITTVNSFRERLQSATGQFSAVIHRGDELWAATDITRNWPLFYSKLGGEYILSDDCYTLADLRPENDFDPASVSCFLASGHTINDRTLLKNIMQAEAGSIVILGSEAKSFFYHNPELVISSAKNIEATAAELSLKIENLFRGYFTALSDRFIAIPLSGGYDSRLIALMASKYHPDNVLCYTYGRKDNPEVALAKESAKRLRLKWINIVYDTDLVGDFIRDDYFEEYFQRVSNLNGMFFLQEYFAVRYLKMNKIIPGNAVFMSGYSGDFIAGSYLIPRMKRQMDNIMISKLIFREYFRFTNLKRKAKQEVIKLIGERMPQRVEHAWKYIESWDLKERHAKFIVNSAKVFSFFGYEYVFPLWDRELVDFMLPMPFSMRMDRRLYEQALRDIIFRQNNLNLDGETNPAPFKKSFQRFKEKIKPLIPSVLRNRFISSYSAILYDEITKVLLNDINNSAVIPPRQPNYYNSYIIQWYLARTAQRFRFRPLR